MDYVIRKERDEYKYMMLWIGLLVYNIGELIRDHLFIIENAMIKAFMYVGILLSAMSVLSCLQLDIKERTWKFWAVFCFTILWLGFMIVNSPRDAAFSFGNYIYPYNTVSYTALLMLVVNQKGYITSFFSFFSKAFVLVFPLFVQAIQDGSNFVQVSFETVAIGSAFIFITNKYHNNRTVAIAAIVLLFSLFIVTIMARRNLMVTIFLYLMMGTFWLFKDGKIKRLETKILAVFAGLLLMVGAVFYYLSDSSFDSIKGRATENTREEVILYFLLDMANPRDIVLGRGIFGQYYAPGADVSIVSGEVIEDRNVVECGYLHLILKGGLVYLSLYLLLLLWAIKRGRKAKNRFVHACVFVLVVQLIDMLPFGLHAFNTKTFLIWLCASVCLSRKFVDLTDDEIRDLFFKKKEVYLSWEKK